MLSTMFAKEQMRNFMFNYLELVPKPGVFFDDDFAHPSAALHGA